MLYRAAEFAWANCAIHFIVGVQEVPALHRDISLVDLYLPDGSLALRATYLLGDQAFDVGPSYKWSTLEDIGDQRRQESARKAAEVQQDRQRAEANARYQAESNRFWSDVWFKIKVFL